MWITDLEVDSRLSGHVRTWNADIISLPLVSGSHLFELFACGIQVASFPGGDSTSVYAAFQKYFTRFTCEVVSRR